MIRSPRISIKVKLVVLIIVISSLAVLVSGLIFTARDRSLAQKNLRERLQETAVMIAGNATAALTSNDQKTASELLGSLMSNEHMLLAALYDRQGKIFAARHRSHKEPPPLLTMKTLGGDDFNADYLEVIAPVHLDNERIGSVILRTDLEEIKQRARDLGATLILVTVAAMVIAVFLSLSLQGLITGPLKDLARAMRRARDERDFSQKLVVESHDETGQLVEIFNDLLARLKESEDHSQLHRNNLEELVMARTIELERVKREAEKQRRIKSEFLANMSHEISSPLNEIIGTAEMAKTKELTPDLEDYLDSINSSASTLLATIKEILDFSKIEAGIMEMEAFNFSLSEVMDNVTSMFTDQAAEKGIEILINTSDAVPRVLCGDPLRLQDVLVNLVNNAMKFTEKGEIEIRTIRAEEDGSNCRLLFSVRDTGIGIAPEKRESLFSAFTQADGSTARKFGGTGLGLFICRQLVEMMDGKIWVEGGEGSGSIFSFTAVFSLPDEEGTALPATIPGLHGKKVLLVEDNHSSRSIFKKMLESFGFEVIACESGAQALKATEGGGNGFDLIILDWMMPGMDGITLARELRHLHGLADVPVLMITAFGRDEQRQKAKEAGIDRFLTKPLKRSQLHDTIIDIFADRSPEVFTVAPGDSEDFSLAGCRVLVVEDNHINRQVAKELLKSFNMLCDTADNGAEAIKAVQRQSYDAVLMDIQMPELDGHEATRCIRRLPGMDRLPIIALTAYATREDHYTCMKSGMNDYITKPIDKDTLLNSLKRWINAPGLTRRVNHSPVEDTPAREAETPPMENLPGIDINAGLRRIGGKREVYLRLLEAFLREYSDINTRVEKLLEEGNMQKLHLLCHSLKGAAGNVSAMVTFEVAGEICQAASTRDPEKIRSLLPQLTSAIKEVKEGVETLTSD